jgi:hypothetical protein
MKAHPGDYNTLATGQLPSPRHVSNVPTAARSFLNCPVQFQRCERICSDMEVELRVALSPT